MTEPPEPAVRSLRNAKAMAHTMNITAHQVVACDNTVAAPRGPNAVWLPAPPNAPAKSAALPLCSSTTMTSTRQFRTKKAVSSHPAQRKPTTISPNPNRSAMPHFIQPGIAYSPRTSSNQNFRCSAGKPATWCLPLPQTTSAPSSLRPLARHPALPAPSTPEYCQVSRYRRRGSAGEPQPRAKTGRVRTDARTDGLQPQFPASPYGPSQSPRLARKLIGYGRTPQRSTHPDRR